ncbi:MAG: hypothetical protein VYE22_35045 [Myxococcota bacterium]|nr:hypothetical protein [Myxococcota bacterium]
MTVRDLGYRAYEGERLPSSQNTWVLLRYGMWRMWGSWIVKLTILAALVSGLIAAALVAATWWVRSQTVGAAGGELPPLPGGEISSFFFNIQVWLFATVLTLRSGAGVIAEDFTFRAFQFYFAKPVTIVQYLVGRVSALTILLFSVLFVPSLFVVLPLTGISAEEHRLEMAGLLLPSFFYSLIAAVALSTLSIGVSAISKSRALTMSAWIVLFVVPHVLALLVDAITDWSWLYLISIPGMLTVLREALFKITTEGSDVEWFHAGPVLGLLVAGAVAYAWNRLQKAEVIT